MTLALILCAIAFALNVADALLTDAILARGGREDDPMILFVIDFTGVLGTVDDTVCIEIADAAGAAYDWTGSTFEMRIGSTRGDGSPAVTLTQADGDVVPSVVSGKSRLTFQFRPEKLGDLAAGTHQHDLIRTLAGRPTAFGHGMIMLRKGVVA